jgi:type IV fimbrial biogenesis protein FimT
MTEAQEQARQRRCRAITLPELLVVVTIISLAVTVSVPLVSGAIRSAELRGAASSFRVSLQAARMIAVTRQAPIDVRVNAHPANRYDYEDSQGRTRQVDLPSSVCIVSATSPTITFGADGSLNVAAVTVFGSIGRQGGVTSCEPGGNDREFEIRTNLLGVSKITRLSGE